MLSLDQMRAVVYLKSPCIQHGVEAVHIPDGPLEGKYCLNCVNEVAQLITDARDEGERKMLRRPAHEHSRPSAARGQE